MIIAVMYTDWSYRIRISAVMNVSCQFTIKS